MNEHTCTMLLAGKDATIDGSTIVCREEDYGDAFDPQKFVYLTPNQQPRHYESKGSKFKSELPVARYGYTSTPDADDSAGVFGAGGINAANVSMTATETITSNPRIRAIDPYNTEDGIGEEDYITLVLPYISSAREGVQRLGKLLEQHGTYEANAIAFGDQQEVWYFETIGGHQWAAVRVPDDSYVIAPNRLNIADFDFDSPDTMCSPRLKELIDAHQLNPGRHGYNFRLIFGSATNQDRVYNNPRAWYVQSQLGGGRTTSKPTNYDLPFACVPDNKLTVEAIKQVMSSHYNGTSYDPYQQEAGHPAPFRSIALNRNLELHILQLRNGVDKKVAGIHWLAFGPNTFNALVPFYANVNDTPAAYRDTKAQYTPDNMYWLVHTLAALGDRDYRRAQPLAEQCSEDVLALTRQLQVQTDKTINGDNCQAELTAVNQQMSSIAMHKLTDLLGKFVAQAFHDERLQF